MRTPAPLALGLLISLGLAAPASAGAARRAPASLKSLDRHTVQMPRAWPGVIDALVTAHRRTGLRYAVVPPVFKGTVGPFGLGQKVKLGDLVGRIARATGTTAHVLAGVVVFDPPGPDQVKPSPDLRQTVHRLALNGRSATIPRLSTLAGDDDPSVRVQALAALARMEGDFIRRTWPGRVSVFEVLRPQLDRQALLWTLIEGERRGGPAWSLALDVLARSREPYLARHTWVPVWYKTPGTLRLCLWAMGRSGDATAGRSLSKRVRKSFTNHPADRYLAAVGLGEINGSRELRRNARHANHEVRRAAVLGLGLCRESDSVIAQLTASLRDTDPGVRFLACQSLGRIGTDRAVGLLRGIAGDAKAAAELRSAALDGLAQARSDAAHQGILAAAGETGPVVRAKAAELLGGLGGPTAQETLLRLVDDKDGRVRAAAACALGRLGSTKAVGRVARFLDQHKTSPDARIAALLGLGRGHAPAAKDALGKIALDVTEPRRLRRYAVLALAQLAGRAGQDTLLALTEFGAPHYMPFALRHLELKTPDDTARHVIRYLARGHRDTSAGAACRLAELGSGLGVRELLEGSDVFDNHARMMHMWGGIRARGPEVVPALVAACSSKRSDIRGSAALALGGRTDVAAVDALITLTRDRSSGVRSAAAQSLGWCSDPKAVPALLRLAREDENRRVLSAAVRSLRLRAFSHRPDVKELFADLAGGERDPGVIAPDRPSVAGQPPNSFVLRRWAATLGDDDMCNITYESSLTYDSDRGRVVLWGAHGRRADAPQTGQTWFYNAGDSSWRRLRDSREWPNATCCIWSTAYDPANRVVVLPLSGRGGHGWVNALRVNMQYSIPWLLDTRTDQWYPAKPPRHKGGLNMVGNSFDPRHAVTACWYGRVSAYDAYSNEWWTMAPGRVGPPKARNGDGVFETKTGRLIAVGPRSTWAYDPAAGKWTDLRPEGGSGPAGAQIVYDAANHAILLFQPDRNTGCRVWAYDIAANRWEKLPAGYPAPHYGTFDVAYDSRRNVTVVSGGWQTGRSGETTVRETWTYRYKPAPAAKPGALGRPRGLTVTTLAGGKAQLAWRAPTAGKPTGYRVYRGAGNRAWRVTWQRLAETKADALACLDAGADTKQVRFYRVTAVDPSGKEGPPSYPMRTAPRAPRWAAAVLQPDGLHVSWSPCPGKDVAGYHVYRAPVAARSHWAKTFNPMELDGKFARVTQRPVAGAEYVDKSAKIEGPASELSWPDSYAYLVRAVNAWGLEGGPSPTTLAVPDAPGPVRVIPWLDGRRLVMWSPGRGPGVRGFYLMRMDDWNRQYVFRWHAAPIVGCGFYDDLDFPTADRRRYYISGVDVLGTVGIPSSGAWSHGFP